MGSMRKLPKGHLHDLVEFLRLGFDAMTLGRMNQTELALIVWVLAGFQPTAISNELWCKNHIV